MDKVLFEGCFALYNKQCAKKSQARSLQEKILKRSLAFSGYLKQWRIQGCVSRALSTLSCGKIQFGDNFLIKRKSAPSELFSCVRL